MLCQDKMAIKTCVQYYIVYICISICRYFISVLYQYVYVFIVLYIEGKHFTTIGNNVLLNTNYSKNTYLFMTYFGYFPEPFHNKYKSDAYMYIYTYACMYVSVIVSAYVRS